MENIATKSRLMIDEMASDLTLALERRLTEVSTAQIFFFVLVRESCCVKLEGILPCFCFAHGALLVNSAFCSHVSLCHVVFVTLA